MLLPLHLREESEDSQEHGRQRLPRDKGTETVSIHETSGDFANPEPTTLGLKPLCFLFICTTRKEI